MKETLLSVGDRCWYYEGTLISFVDITHRSTHFEGESLEFSMYRVQKVIGDRSIPSVHRSQLFKCPEEQEKLLTELRKDFRRLGEYIDELTHRDEGYVPDLDKDDI